jgi:hypothetical protein
MRYLNKREDFLREKNSNSINKIRSINEADTSGPFANDVGWNDSLLGRLINHVIRKARIARKVGQIKKLIERLQEQFDYLVDQSTVFSLGDDSQLLLLRITLSSFFKELIFAVENGRPVSELIGLTDGAIKAVNDVKELDKKDVLLEELKKFREFLNQFKDDESTTDEESTDTDTTTADTTGLSDTKLIDLMFKNLEALKNIIYYKDVVKKDVEKPTFKVGDIVMFTNAQKKKNKVKILSLDHQITAGVDKIFLTKDDGPIAPEPKVNIKPNLFVVYVDASGNPIKNSKNTYSTFPASPEQLTIESMIFEKENLQYRNPVEKTRTNTIGNKSGANIDRNNIFKGEDPHLTQSLDNLKKAIDGLIGSQNQPPITIDFINNILANKLDNRKVIKSLYKEVNEFMVGKYKLSDLGPLYKEGIGVEYLTKRNQLNMVAKKIALFAKRALQFNGENMYGGLGDLGKHLKIFVDTLIPLTKATINEGVDILGYNSFLEAKNILPAGTPDKTTGATATPQGGDAQGGTASNDAQGQGEDGGDQSKKILEFFNQTCVEVRAFTATDEEITKLKEELEAKKKEGGEVIMSMDPIIEIMKLFIKAYKLYTVQTITKRTEKVDTNTLSEYTSFGGGSTDDSGRNGPYRNNKLFDAWEEGVNNIRKNRKYQVFFTKNAKLRLPTVPDPNPAKADNWEIKDNAGINFNRFINDILDGDKLYKSGTDRGKAAVFVDSYFGEGAVTKNGEGVMTTVDENELKEAAALEGSKKKVELEFGKVPVKNEQLQTNTLFTITYTNDKDQPRQRTFLITELKGGYVYMSYALVKHYNKYLDRMNGTQKTITKGTSLPVNLSTTDGAAIGYTKLKQNQFNDIFKVGNTITVNSVANDGSTSAPVFKGISDVYWMVKTEDKKIYIIDNSSKPKLSEVITSYQDKNSTLQVESKSGIEIKKS